FSGVYVKNPVSGIKQYFISGKVATDERPIRMVVQLLIAFVEAICQREKRQWIGHMNRNWHVESPASVPHGIKSRIVNLHKFARGNILAKVVSQSLKNLQAPRALPVGLFDG